MSIYTLPKCNNIKKYNGYSNICDNFDFIGHGGYGIVFKVKINDEVYIMKHIKCSINFPCQVVFNEITSLYKFDIYKLNIDGVIKLKGIEIFETNKINLFFNYEGETLSNFILTNSLSSYEKKNIFNKIIEIVKNIHKKGYFHGDLTLQNILINNYNNSLYPTIIDLGLCRHIRDGICSIPNKMYIPPDKNFYDNKNYDGRKLDIWSLGIIKQCLDYNTIYPQKLCDKNIYLNEYSQRKLLTYDINEDSKLYNYKSDPNKYLNVIDIIDIHTKYNLKIESIPTTLSIMDRIHDLKKYKEINRKKLLLASYIIGTKCNINVNDNEIINIWNNYYNEKFINVDKLFYKICIDLKWDFDTFILNSDFNIDKNVMFFLAKLSCINIFNDLMDTVTVYSAIIFFKLLYKNYNFSKILENIKKFDISIIKIIEKLKSVRENIYQFERNGIKIPDDIKYNTIEDPIYIYSLLNDN